MPCRVRAADHAVCAVIGEGESLLALTHLSDAALSIIAHGDRRETWRKLLAHDPSLSIDDANYLASLGCRCSRGARTRFIAARVGSAIDGSRIDECLTAHRIIRISTVYFPLARLS